MQNQLPTHSEILNKYRSVIDQEDFEILAGETFPKPEALHEEDATLQYIGTINGSYLWAKRQLGRVVAIIVFFGGFVQGLEYLNKYSRIGYNHAVSIFQQGQQHCDMRADEYRIFDQPNEWGLPPDEPFVFATTETTTTTSTTTEAPDRRQRVESLMPGSGLVPYSEGWDHLG